jgi:hypothetical protein
LVVVALGGGAAPARAGGACPDGGEAAAGPLPGGDQPADFGAVPEACGGTDVALRLRGALLIARSMPDYYGSVIAGAMFRGRRRLGARAWLSLAIDALDYRYVSNANLVSSGTSFGPPTLGFHYALGAGARTAAAVYGRVLLPLDTARSNGVETGPEAGGVIRTLLRGRWAADGGVGFSAPIDVVAGQAHARLETTALAEAWWAPRATAALFAGASVRAELAPDPAFITAVPRIGGRMAVARRFWTALLAEVPVAGTDRTDVIVSLFLGFTP